MPSDPDARLPHLSARGRVAARRLPARQPAGGGALDGADELHRHERLVLARRQAAPPGLRALRPRPTRRRLRARDPRRPPDPRGARAARARVLAVSTAAPTGFTCSSRLRAERPSSRPTRSRSAWRAGSRSGTRGWSRPNGWKHKREGVAVDHRQNAGKTIASVYSVRPKPGAPISTPLRWDELTEDVTPRRYGIARGARAGRTARRPVRARARGRPGTRTCSGRSCASALIDERTIASSEARLGAGGGEGAGWRFWRPPPSRHGSREARGLTSGTEAHRRQRVPPGGWRMCANTRPRCRRLLQAGA